ncbi:hypothetical protein MYCTH_2308921 [Thermothelomyces thermophilus ATCC 42464]|uniref:non-specific serine/threonine protein kinase n=1 Tax=Thermothelomyces thermophilus (strain ATCC 42464 / BCRC 31852 / DSM 1799) TaxID=573729 RepID=G2QKH6_THET4|nr:uncharacterized protein MYCTH_2308921 [Thermothelomyces thermophilus ATCC 42464]AEO60082.1 hypothetical protein MYCTH_2308921 [Thermothelomyces thermophilus ATCC 42464]
MVRRPPGHVAPQRKYLLALALILLPWLPLADAQQQHQRQPVAAHQLRSPSEDDQHAAVSGLTATTAVTGRETAEIPRIQQQRKALRSREADGSEELRQRILAHPRGDHDVYDDGSNKNNDYNRNHNNFNSDDARAPALAPDLSVRAPPPSQYRGPNPGAGLSQHVARSLEDWEVEDFVLLATVDGDLYASDRKTGQERWHFKADHPMVETRHFRTNRSVLDDDYDPIDHYIWVVEPTRDGELYLWRPNENGAGLAKMTLTMKKLVEELAPFNDKTNRVLYTGDKKTTMVTLNAATGTIIKQFGSTGSYVNKVESESCFKPNALADGEEECSEDRTITLGRTEYTVSIHRSDGQPIASLKYSEWGPNMQDSDLVQQNLITKDSRYVTSQHDGKIYGFEYGRFSEERPVFTKTLSSPVARVFDVLHRWEPSTGKDPELIVLPQPPLPAGDEDSLRLRSEKVFINQTEEGGWYALSGSRYPLILSAPLAPIHRVDWWRIREAWDLLPESQKSKALVGTHQLPNGLSTADTVQQPASRLLLDAPRGEPEGLIDGNIAKPPPPPPLPPPQPEPSRIFETAKRVPEFVVTRVFDLVSNPAAIVIFVVTVWVLYKERIVHFGRSFKGRVDLLAPGIAVSRTEPGPEAPPKDKTVVAESAEPKTQIAAPDAASDAAPVNTVVPVDTVPAIPAVDAPPEAPPDAQPKPQVPSREPPPTVTFAEPPANNEAAEGAEAAAAAAEPVKKKKGHRGRRGGVKHRKGGNKDKRDNSQSRDDDPAQETVDEVVNKAKTLVREPKLEPDIITVSGAADEVSGHILKMGSLEVNEAEQLGTGSNGTIVFAGKWDGRDVAVKRMLVQFNEIASQETRLLRESDDHPNVIRYYAQQERAAFLYIALELCQASLADIIQKPHCYRELAQAGERDLPGVLYQIASGLSHLHSLRIVHRDLKPQNILVNMGKNGQPRILVSDFGLCKKLEGGQSSFGATTAHAAGTTGWRAPELLIDDDAPGSTTMTLTDPGSSLHSASGSGVVEGPGPHSRRVTRAIDIFSLGLVFFYVLTRGNHPFDCGDRFMREVNIRKGNYSLQLLDSLGDFAFEARDLIGSMLNANPKLRPTALEVMAHPFFWNYKKRLAFLCDVSDHFEKEPRDPPSAALSHLESYAPEVVQGDFLKHLPREFVESLGKQRKYTGTRLLDLLRALRNKRNHYEDMPDSLKKTVGPLPDGYLAFWACRFPNLLIVCWNVVYNLHWENTDRFRDYYVPAPPSSSM